MQNYLYFVAVYIYRNKFYLKNFTACLTRAVSVLCDKDENHVH